MATDDLQTLKLDNEGDLVVEQDSVGNKSFTLLRGVDVVRQDIQVRILSLLGERILHPTYGLDFPAIETPFNADLVRGEMVRTILQDPDVLEILNVEVQFDGRKRRATFSGTVRLKDDRLIGVAGTT